MFRLSACHPALHFWKRTLLNSPFAFRVNRPLGVVEEPSRFPCFFCVVRDSKQDTHFTEHQKQTFQNFQLVQSTPFKLFTVSIRSFVIVQILQGALKACQGSCFDDGDLRGRPCQKWSQWSECRRHNGRGGSRGDSRGVLNFKRSLDIPPPLCGLGVGVIPAV